MLLRAKPVCLDHTFVAMSLLFAAFMVSSITTKITADEITTAGKPARLDVRAAGEHSVRVTLMPVEVDDEFPHTPALAEREYADAAISIREIDAPVQADVGALRVEVRPSPLTVIVTTADGDPVQSVTFEDDGTLSFAKSDKPILGLGEGGPQPSERGDWRQQEIQFDRNGAFHQMIPRWESNAYGSRNPVAMMISADGWGMFIATPWGEIDLREDERGVFSPWQPPEEALEQQQSEQVAAQNEQTQDNQQRGAGQRRGRRGGQRGRGGRQGRQNLERALQGRPPVDSIIAGAFDVFIFDAREPANVMKDVSDIAGAAVIPPKWALGYMQSHRELQDANMESEELLLWVADTFREKRIPVDALIYLGTGFTPTGWNTRQPSFDFNPEVFHREPSVVLNDLHERNFKVIVHMVPWGARRLPTLHGSIPPADGDTVDASHIQSYWREHVGLVNAGIDAWWPDEGDRFNLFERIKRHQLYYVGPLSTEPDERPWSLHRNGHLGVAKWGGWVWSGDTQSAWKTLEGQIAVGLNHSLSLSPYWGSDTAGFYAGIDPPELSGELYARWFQFSAFCPSFRSHGRIWRLRAPFGWGLAEMGDHEGQRFPPSPDEMNNPAIEPVCRMYAELRYQLIPYTYTLAAEARETGMPFMRSLWLHYPRDEQASQVGDEYLWGRDLLIAPVFEQGATSRDVYLPAGDWYDWWSGERHAGGRTITREVDLETMPIFARAGAIIPFDPVRQYMEQEVDEPTTIRVFTGSDGEYRWYEDDGKSQAYLSGEFAWTNFNWNDESRTLSIQRDQTAGQMELPARELVIQLLPEGTTKTIRYDGSRVVVEF